MLQYVQITFYFDVCERIHLFGNDQYNYNRLGFDNQIPILPKCGELGTFLSGLSNL